MCRPGFILMRGCCAHLSQACAAADADGGSVFSLSQRLLSVAQSDDADDSATRDSLRRLRDAALHLATPDEA